MTVTERIQDRFNAGLVYGDPVEQDGVIVIPAARVMGGGGGGSDGSQGEGGGFGLRATPAGAWVFKSGSARWRPAINLNAIILGGQLVGISYLMFAWLVERSKARAIAHH
jgi:uncharacterized spore protein YtfJ